MPELHAPNLPEGVEVKKLRLADWHSWLLRRGGRAVFLVSYRGEAVTYVMCPPWWDDGQIRAALETAGAKAAEARDSV